MAEKLGKNGKKEGRKEVLKGFDGCSVQMQGMMGQDALVDVCEGDFHKY